MKKSFFIIKCPKCGWEYLPEEIFINVLGKPKNVLRDKDGRILFFDGESMELQETYICDNCNCTFISEIKPLFETRVDVNHDFSEDYSVKIYEDRIELQEPNEESLW